MSINNHKIVLIIGACDKKHRLNSYVAKSSNGISLQIIDVTKDVKALQTYDQYYLDYINQTVSFFIGEEIEKIDAVIFYSTETHFNNAFIKKLNPQCLVIHYSDANMTEREIIEHIGLYNEQLNIESKDDSDKNLVFMKSAQDLQSTFDKVNNDLSSTFPVPALTNSQILSQGFAGFFVRKKAAVTLSESENIFDIRWPV